MYSGKNVSLQLGDDRIAKLVFDVHDKRVNIFNTQTVNELSEILDALSGKDDIRGLLVCSAKESFIAGADINEFAPTFLEGAEKITELLNKSNHNFNRIQSLPFPVVAAINGFALGGGCELALACDYRIATQDARIGLPETRLGIIPGWGGTVRLPRIAGIETAIEWIASGKDYRASVALEKGVIDAIAAHSEQLDIVAQKMLLSCMNGQLDYLSRRQQKQNPLKHNAIERELAFMTSVAMVSAQAGLHYPAPVAAVKAMAAAAICHFDDALAIETQAFVNIAQTPEALSLSGIFLNDQLLTKKSANWQKQVTGVVSKAAVIGAGIMGGGIAYQSALKGISVRLKDVSQEGIDLGLNEAAVLLSKRHQQGRLSLGEVTATLNRIVPCVDYQSFDDLDVVVEAVVENPIIKKQVLAEVEAHVSEDTIIASNTSTISIDSLAAVLQRPENFCGMHFFNPVHAMPLVEVVRGKQTSDAAIAATVAYASAMGKKAIVVRDCPGFLVNRVLFPYFAGFLMLLRDGVDFQRIDRLMEQWGWPMGPAYLLDVVGLDTAVHAAKVMAQGFPSRMQYDFVLATEVLQECGRLGQKNHQGFYDYVLNKKGRRTKVASAKANQLIANQVVTGTQTLSDEEIVWRMMLPMATELARCLEEDIVESVCEADMALVYGLGFPPFRGGIFRWIDSKGIDVICQQCHRLSSLGESYQATQGMLDNCAEKKPYYAMSINHDALPGKQEGESL